MITLKDVLTELEVPAWSAHGTKTVNNIRLLKKKTFELHFIITSDLKGAEEKLKEQHGGGYTYCFSLPDYESGKRLMVGLFQHLRLKRPQRFSDPCLLYVGKPLFLFCHISQPGIRDDDEIWIVDVLPVQDKPVRKDSTLI